MVEPPVVSEASPIVLQNVDSDRPATKYDASSLPAARRWAAPTAKTVTR